VPPFERPRFAYDYVVAAQVRRLRAHKEERGIPARRPKSLLAATWNIANFGQQERCDKDHHLIAEICGWFDVVAVQELKENFAPLFDVRHQLGGGYRVVFSDVGGNGERVAFLYDSEKVQLLEEVGEVAFPTKDLKAIKAKGVRQPFQGFDRTPYLATFEIRTASFLLVNVHLYFGGNGKAAMERRVLETLAVAKYAAMRRTPRHAFTREVIALGDLNMPNRDSDDPIYRAITSRGLELPKHNAGLGSNLAVDKHYDNIGIFPGATNQCRRQLGTFDYDEVVFADLWQDRGQKDFAAYCWYYISDHRPLWMELAIP
jgi:endonuclease/exonuclease/phosphatase family metal-dependent hydrolase